MIQRVQTLFLLAIIGFSSILIFKPFEMVKNGGEIYLVSLMPGALTGFIKPTIYGPMALNFMIILLSMATIFQFKRRRKQIKYTQVILALSTLLIGSLFVFEFTKIVSTNLTVDYTVYAFIPAVNIVLALLTRYFIIKDDKLVKSADRIR